MSIPLPKKKNAPGRANQAILSLSLVKLFKRREEKRREEKRRKEDEEWLNTQY